MDLSELERRSLAYYLQQRPPPVVEETPNPERLVRTYVSADSRRSRLLVNFDATRLASRLYATFQHQDISDKHVAAIIKDRNDTVCLPKETGYIHIPYFGPTTDNERLQTFAKRILEHRNMPNIPATIVTGSSDSTLGLTRLSVGMVDRHGNYVLTDFDKHVPGVGDNQTSRISSSTKGSKAGNYLGFWSTRQLTLPHQSKLFVEYKVKTSVDHFAKSLSIPLVADETAPWLELQFPVVSDTYSTLNFAHIAGRLRLMRYDELVSFNEKLETHLKAIADCEQTFELFGPEVLDAHWTRTVNGLRGGESGDWSDLFRISLEGRAVDIKVRKILGAVITEKQRSVKRVVTKPTGKKITVARKARKIKI